MNKILITGLALLSFSDSDECNLCNYDFSWIFNYPSVLLWADKIILTPYIKSVINKCRYPAPDTPLPKAIKILFDMLEDSDLLETKKASEILTEEGLEQIDNQVENDRILLSDEFPSLIKLGDEKEVPGQLFIEQDEYCRVRIISIYTGLLLSRAWNASCLFSTEDYNYLRFRFGIKNIPTQTSKGYLESFNMIFRSLLPNLPLIPHYAHGTECENCLHEKKCATNYLNDLEKNTHEILKWRGYEEIHQLKDVIQKAINKFNSPEEIDPKEVYRELHEKELKLNTLIHKTFPKIRRWSSLVTCLSVPFAVAGIAYQDALLTLSGAAFIGSTKIASELLKLMENKYRWVGFLNRKYTQIHTK